ncbi:MAG: hypothetical protein P0120_07815 [Nitrospira sp.]|nr:hypothetical protein [Nitrospira sp.]
MMVLQCFSDCTLIAESGTRLIGPGELVMLPAREALRVMELARAHFKIVKPTPLLPGVVVCWASPDGCVKGPGIVQLVDGHLPDRRISVLNETGLRWICEEAVVDIDPWPAIDAKLEEAVDYVLLEGYESPKFIAVCDWIRTHFNEDKDLWTR